TNEGQYLPKIVGALDADWRHRGHDALMPYGRVALTLQFGAAERDQPEQAVIVAAVHPDLVGHRRTQGPAAGGAVAAAAGVALKQRLSLSDDIRLSVPVRIGELPLGGALGQIHRGEFRGIGWRLVRRHAAGAGGAEEHAQGDDGDD